jgi:hypothetical protein
LDSIYNDQQIEQISFLQLFNYAKLYDSGMSSNNSLINERPIEFRDDQPTAVLAIANYNLYLLAARAHTL